MHVGGHPERRHLAASQLDAAGMTAAVPTSIIGHSDERVTNAVYTHVDRGRIAAAAQRFDPLAAVVFG
jgi:hypothetical protein